LGQLKAGAGGFDGAAVAARGPTVATTSSRAAKSYSSGTPEQTCVLKGVARTNRQRVAEVVERAD